MGAAYSAAQWSGFGATVATASAALTGFLFIAVSINLTKILAEENSNLPGRAALTLMLFSTPLVSSLLLIVPGQPRLALGVELLGLGLLTGPAEIVIDVRAGPGPPDRTTALQRMLGRVFPIISSSTCLVLAGVTLVAQAGGGLYWLVPSALIAIMFGLLNVWVLLVEIMR
jgi:hypothetical protein